MGFGCTSIALVSSPRDASLSLPPVCRVQSFDRLLRRDGLYVAGLIGPDQTVTAVQFSHQDSTIMVTAHFMLAADAADGATSDSVAAVDCAAAIECLSALAVKVSPVDEWLATQQQAEEEAAKAEEAAAKAEGQQQQAAVQKEVQPAAAAKVAADAPAEPSSSGRAAAKPKQSKKRAREAAAKEEEEAEEEESKAVKRVTRTRSGSK